MKDNVIPKIRKTLVSVTLVCASISLPLIAIEVFLRLFTPDWLELRMSELTAGQAYEVGSDRSWPIVQVNTKLKNFVPNSSFPIRHLEYQNKANIDEFGGRKTDYQKSTVIVPFLGDSFTFGVGVENQETYVSILSSKSEVRFLNLGVPGSALHHQNDIIEMRHNELGKPKLYIFSTFIGNDFADIQNYYISKASQKELKEQKLREQKVKERAVKGKKTDDIRSWLLSINLFVYHNNLLKRIYTIQFFRQRLLSLVNRNSPETMNPIFRIARKDQLYLKGANMSFRKELERLKKLSDNLKFDVAFIILPDVYQVNQDLMKVKAKYYSIEQNMLDMLAPNRILEKNFREYQIHFIDTTACLMENKNIDRLYYTQDKHFTKYGHEVVAECIKKKGFYSFIEKYFRFN